MLQRIKKHLLIIASLVSVIILSLFVFRPEQPLPESLPPETQQIRILRIHLSETSTRMEDLGLLPGAYKANRRPITAGQLFYRVTSDTGITVAQGAFPDPRVLYYDAPLDDSGRLEGGVIHQEEAVFDILLPQFDQSAVIEILDYTRSADGELLLTSPIAPR